MLVSQGIIPTYVPRFVEQIGSPAPSIVSAGSGRDVGREEAIRRLKVSSLQSGTKKIVVRKWGGVADKRLVILCCDPWSQEQQEQVQRELRELEEMRRLRVSPLSFFYGIFPYSSMLDWRVLY